MGEIFIGTEAVANGVVTRHELSRWYRPLYPNVHTLRGQALTLHDRTVGAWLWSKREGIVTGVAASALHGAEWVDADSPIELIFNCTRPPSGVAPATSESRMTSSVGLADCRRRRRRAPPSIWVGICPAVKPLNEWTR